MWRIKAYHGQEDRIFGDRVQPKSELWLSGVVPSPLGLCILGFILFGKLI